jgi:hypothetical protein
MSNNKQETGVQWFFDQLVANRIIVIDGSTYWDKVKTKYEILLEQAKEMEIAGKEMSYAEGYKEGYHRAIENAKYQINKWIDKELKITQP